MTHRDRLALLAAELIDAGISLPQAVEQFKGVYAEVGLARTRGNVTRAAVVLGVHRNTLHNKLRIVDSRRAARRELKAHRMRRRLQRAAMVITGSVL